jgi:hypothetical protein
MRSWAGPTTCTDGILGRRTVVGDAYSGATTRAGDAGGDVQQAVAQLLRLRDGEFSLQEKGLVQASRSMPVRASSSQTALMANTRDGKRPKPVSLPQRMRSSKTQSQCTGRWHGGRLRANH